MTTPMASGAGTTARQASQTRSLATVPPGMRHIGLNLLYLVPGEVGGSEIYARRLVGALATEAPDTRFTVFCGREAAPSLRAEGWPANVGVHTIPVNARNKPLRIAAEITLLPAAA